MMHKCMVVSCDAQVDGSVHKVGGARAYVCMLEIAAVIAVSRYKIK